MTRTTLPGMGETTAAAPADDTPLADEVLAPLVLGLATARWCLYLGAGGRTETRREIARTAVSVPYMLEELNTTLGVVLGINTTRLRERCCFTAVSKATHEGTFRVARLTTEVLC